MGIGETLRYYQYRAWKDFRSLCLKTRKYSGVRGSASCVGYGLRRAGSLSERADFTDQMGPAGHPSRDTMVSYLAKQGQSQRLHSIFPPNKVCRGECRCNRYNSPRRRDASRGETTNLHQKRASAVPRMVSASYPRHLDARRQAHVLVDVDNYMSMWGHL